MADAKTNSRYVRKTTRTLVLRDTAARCEGCGADFTYQRATGNPRKYCSHACRMRVKKAAFIESCARRGKCSTAGCDRTATYEEGICNSCYWRRKRTGTTQFRQWMFRGVNSNGYVVLSGPLARKHDMVSSNGQLFEHRKVLYDHLGPSSQSCHWCGITVYWKPGMMQKGHSKTRLVVDHLDGDKANNALANLVPACNPCNAMRGMFMRWVQEHKDDPVLWVMYLDAKAKPQAA